MDNQTTTVVISKAQAIKKLVDIFTQMKSLNEVMKEAKTAIKDAGYDAAAIAAVAKAVVNDKLKELEDKSNNLLDLIETAKNS